MNFDKFSLFAYRILNLPTHRIEVVMDSGASIFMQMCHLQRPTYDELLSRNLEFNANLKQTSMTLLRVQPFLVTRQLIG